MTEIELTLDPGAKDPLAVVNYVAREPRTVDRFDLGTAPAGFTARRRSRRECLGATPRTFSWS
ncbi:MAG: hypothetical protein L0H93_14380 [Nocardioides sp.]|nr:hypothetical protein [Nocardioides sp.]